MPLTPSQREVTRLLGLLRRVSEAREEADSMHRIEYEMTEER